MSDNGMEQYDYRNHSWNCGYYVAAVSDPTDKGTEINLRCGTCDNRSEKLGL